MTALPNPVLLRQYGYFLVERFVDEEECDSLAAELTGHFEREAVGTKRKLGGVRNLLRLSHHVQQLASSSTITELLRTLTGQNHFPVRAIFFDKTPESNWNVPWHQDLAIAVARRIEVTGFSAWSEKEGVPHVKPPIGVLENMLTLRLHLDACDGTMVR